MGARLRCWPLRSPSSGPSDAAGPWIPAIGPRWAAGRANGVGDWFGARWPTPAPGARRGMPVDRGLPRHRHARPGRDQDDRTQWDQRVRASEQPTRKGSQARQRRAPPATQPQRTRAPRRGRREVSDGGRASGRNRDPKAMRTRAQRVATRRQPRRSSRLCRANAGCRERSDRNPKCVTTPYALFLFGATATDPER